MFLGCLWLAGIFTDGFCWLVWRISQKMLHLRIKINIPVSFFSGPKSEGPISSWYFEVFRQSCSSPLILELSFWSVCWLHGVGKFSSHHSYSRPFSLSVSLSIFFYFLSSQAFGRTSQTVTIMPPSPSTRKLSNRWARGVHCSGQGQLYIIP